MHNGDHITYSLLYKSSALRIKGTFYVRIPYSLPLIEEKKIYNIIHLT